MECFSKNTEVRHMPVKMKPVESSNISHIGHDPEANEMHVTFKSGSTYVYSDVDAKLHEIVTTSASVGSAVNKMIKQRDFRKL